MLWFRILCGAAFLLIAIPQTMACVVCVPVPKETTADVLLASYVVAFAREHPRRPYSYQIVETLNGRFDNTPIGLLVDSVTRRRLLAQSESRVLLVRRSMSTDWDNLGFADAAYQSFTRTVLSNADRWRQRSGRRDRLNYFETLLTSHHDTLRRQAVLEISRGPYRRIRTAASRVPRQDIYAVLRDVTWLEWSPLYVVMLGQSRLVEDRAFVARRFKSNARHASRTYLAAWTTAFIEMERLDAIQFIAETYFRQESYDRGALVEMQKALSVLGSEYPRQVRPAVVAAYQTLLSTHPSMAGYVARDCAAWRDWSLVPLLRTVKARDMRDDSGAAYAVSYYLSMARDALRP